MPNGDQNSRPNERSEASPERLYNNVHEGAEILYERALAGSAAALEKLRQLAELAIEGACRAALPTGDKHGGS
jgi:hypothetical protein